MNVSIKTLTGHNFVVAVDPGSAQIDIDHSWKESFSTSTESEHEMLGGMDAVSARAPFFSDVLAGMSKADLFQYFCPPHCALRYRRTYTKP